jgi:hypothetical protein
VTSKNIGTGPPARIIIFLKARLTEQAIMGILESIRRAITQKETSNDPGNADDP